MDFLTMIELEEQARHRQVQYALRWPRHCRACKGVGGWWYEFDPSPSGIPLGPGTMRDFDTCQACIESDICPRCGKALPGERGNWKLGIMFFVEVPSWLDVDRLMIPECPWCGFVSEISEGMPELPELDGYSDYISWEEGLLE